MIKNKVKIGINGFGRIGRAIAKINAEHNYFDLVIINDINPYVDNLAYLFKYDSTYGRFPGDVESTVDEIIINGDRTLCTSHSDLSDVPWDKYDVSILIDSSGVENNIFIAKKIIQDGVVNKVVVTHSSKIVDNEIIMGLNDDTLQTVDNVVSNSICDANAIAHILKWVNDEYGVTSGSLTTLHPWLSYQNLVDGPSISQKNPGVVWTDYALGRASVDSLIPKDTTAMTAIERVLPQLTGKILSFSYRIPTDIVASSDITLNLENQIDEGSLRSFLIERCRDSDYISTNNNSLVSLDYEQLEESAVIDLQWLKVVDNTVKIVLWYDNEWGYNARVLDLVSKLVKYI